MNVDFEYNFEELENDELRINGKRTDSFGGGVWDSIIINKSWISWIITTLRTTTIDDYETWGKNIVKKFIGCELALMMHPRDNDYSYITIFPIWNDEKRRTPGIEIPYLSWSPERLMSEFIEPFLLDLSKFLTEEEKQKLPKSWDRNSMGKKSNNTEGQISLKFVEEINPKDYFAK